MTPTAAFCTHCGTAVVAAPPERAKKELSVTSRVAAWVISVSLVAILGIWALPKDRPETKAPVAVASAAKETPTSSGDDDTIKPEHIKGDYHFGCQDQEFTKKLGQYATEGDKTLFEQNLNAGLLTGECIFFKNGEPVFLEDTAFFSGLAKVRQPGNEIEYWIQSGALLLTTN